MKSMNKLALIVAMSTVMVAATQAATDAGHGKITFKGSIIDAACSINANSLEQTIEMGAISKKQLSAGGKSTPVDFTIELNDCDTATAQNATVTFNGIAGDQAAGLDGAFAVTGQGQGVGIAITDMGGTVIKPNTPSPKLALNNGTNELMFTAYVQGSSVADAVVPGAFQSVANFVMGYE